MDQRTYMEVSAMMNAFPQGSSDPDVLIASIERAVANVPDQAVSEAAQRFIAGLVDGQHKTFAPSVAEFCTEARRIASLLPFRDRKSLPSPASSRPYQRDDLPTRIRMGFKMSVLSASFGIKDGADQVAEANARGLEDLIALGQRWGVPVPEELWAQLRGRAA